MKIFLLDKIIKLVHGFKFANYQLSIINFTNNFQMFKFSKRNDVLALFENLRIDNSLKIGNWKLKIKILNKNVVVSESDFGFLSFNLRFRPL